MRKILCALLILPFMVMGQDVQKSDTTKEGGIHFESGLSWKDILAKAKVENKPIFMDCYATWCGPCKYMDKNIFSLKDVGEYFNSHFINVRVQMDSTVKDSQFIRDWHKDAAYLEHQYKIVAYPSYLFFSADGRPIHKFTGGYEADVFLPKAADALNSEKQYFALLADWKNHKEDSAYLLKTLIVAGNASDEISQREIVRYYINCLKEPVTQDNITLLYPLVISEKEVGFQLYLQHAARIDLLMGRKDYAEYKLGEAIFKEEIAPLLSKKEKVFKWKEISSKIQDKYKELNTELFIVALDSWFQNFIGQEIRIEAAKKNMRPEDWSAISMKLRKKYIGYDCGWLLLNNEAQYYWDKQSWDVAARVSISLINQYGAKMEVRDINNICWNVIFLHSEDKHLLGAALKNMESIVKINPEDCASLDTYANLLYKLGQRTLAIDWENKAISVAAKKKLYAKEWQANLEKMQKGEPTWQQNSSGS